MDIEKVALFGLIYILATTFFFAGYTRGRFLKWVTENPKDAFRDLVYINPFFYLLVGASLYSISVLLTIFSFLTFFIVAMINNPDKYHIEFGKRPLRIKLLSREGDRDVK
jgi:hypothetical protein